MEKVLNSGTSQTWFSKIWTEICKL